MWQYIFTICKQPAVFLQFLFYILEGIGDPLKSSLLMALPVSLWHIFFFETGSQLWDKMGKDCVCCAKFLKYKNVFFDFLYWRLYHRHFTVSFVAALFLLREYCSSNLLKWGSGERLWTINSDQIDELTVKSESFQAQIGSLQVLDIILVFNHFYIIYLYSI